MNSAIQKEPLRSKEFDDVYFSAVDGLAETRHVFLEGNNLPEQWAARKHFVIMETGFGTGLNFLAVWKMFKESAAADQVLEFISFEKYPLKPEQIRSALALWRDEFSEMLERMIESYPEDRRGAYHLKMDEQVTLTLIFEDVNEALPKLDARVDCWFLDGFKPSSNPEMWSDIVFENMARLSRVGACFATFTAAGFVRRGLQGAGFDVRKVLGFGRKREMLTGVKL